MGDVDLSKFGISDKTKIYDAGAVCVNIKLRQLKIGSHLIQQSLQHAKDNGAEFYFVHAVSRLVVAKIYIRYSQCKSGTYQLDLFGTYLSTSPLYFGSVTSNSILRTLYFNLFFANLDFVLAKKYWSKYSFR